MVDAVLHPTLILLLVVMAGCASPAPSGPTGPTTFPFRPDTGRVPQAHLTTAGALIRAAQALEAGDRRAAGEELGRAAASSPQPDLAEHLSAASNTWETGGGAERVEATLLRAGSGPLIAPLFVAPSGHIESIQLGTVDVDEQAPLDYLLGNLNRFEEWAGIGGRGDRASRDRVVIARLIARGGAVEDGSMHTYLPEDSARREAVGSCSVFWRGMLLECWWKPGVKPVAELLLVPDQAALVTPEAHLRWYATRFGTYQVGPRLLREHFGEDWDALVTTRADVTSMLARTWLALEGTVHPQEAMDATCTLVAMAFRALADAESGEASAAQARAARLQLQWLVELGAIVLEEGRVRIDGRVARDASKALITELATIAVQRDASRGRALLDRGDRLPEEWRALYRAAARLPREERVPVFE